jgi:hypothetical protein
VPAREAPSFKRKKGEGCRLTALALGAALAAASPAFAALLVPPHGPHGPHGLHGGPIGTAAVAIMAMVEGIGLVDAGSLGPWAAPSSAERSQQRPITTATRATRGTAISHGAGSISGGGRFASKHGRRGRLLA